MMEGHLAFAAKLLSLDLTDSELIRSTLPRTDERFKICTNDDFYGKYIDSYVASIHNRRQPDGRDLNLKPMRLFRKPAKYWDCKHGDYRWLYDGWIHYESGAKRDLERMIIDIDCCLLDDWRLKEWGLHAPELVWQRIPGITDEDGKNVYELVEFQP